jgi:hypothetical protein
MKFIAILLYGNLFFFLLFSGCCPSSKMNTHMIDKRMENKEYKNSIPPGTADIKAEIINVSESGEICKLKIIEVLGYGSSVTPISPGTEIESFIPETLLKNEAKKLKEGEEIFARISLREAREANKYWEIIRFNK